MREAAGDAGHSRLPYSWRCGMGGPEASLHREVSAASGRAETGTGHVTEAPEGTEKRAPEGTKNEAPEDTEELALGTLKAICRDLKAPASARAMASRTLLEAAGKLGKGTQIPGTKAPAEMTAEELEIELSRNSRNPA